MPKKRPAVLTADDDGLAGNAYTLKPEQADVWISVDNLNIWLCRTSYGVLIDIIGMNSGDQLATVRARFDADHPADPSPKSPNLRKD